MFGLISMMSSPSTSLDEDWRCFSALGIDAEVERGTSVTAQTGLDCPPYWFSGDTSIILGGSPRRDEPSVSETIASWSVSVDTATIQHFRSGFLVVACLRFFGGLHSYKRDSRADVFVNDQQIDGFALRIIPPDHSDYFHRIPVPTIPDVWPLSGCQTLYAWPLRRENLDLAGRQQIRIRIDQDVRWDIDYVGFLVRVGKRPPRVFLSHNWEDKDIARALASKLSARGIGVWLDEAEIRLGDSLIEKIRAAIDEVEYVVALLSKNSIDSPWVNKELDIAMNQEIESRRVKVLPIRLDDSDLPGFLKGKLYGDLRSPEKLDRVLTLIEARLRT